MIGGKLLLICLIFVNIALQAQHTDNLELSKKKAQIVSIFISGNKRTKTNIVTRELTFKQYDTIALLNLNKELERSRQNLMNTSLFNFIVFTTEFNVDSSELVISIDLKERWYTWPSPIFEIQDRNFNAWWSTKDLFRINYGMFLCLENVRGKKESLELRLRRGYTELYGIYYNMPYINKKQSIGINFSINYSRNNEINYNTYGNRLLFYRNYNKYVRKEFESKIGINYRKGLYSKHSLELLFNETNVDDTIKKLNNNYYLFNNNHLTYFSLQYRFRMDFRDNKAYPLKGYCFDVIVTKDGLNLLKDENIDNLNIQLGARKYLQLYKRAYVSAGIKLRYSLNSIPVYYFNKALGYSDFVRGYEYYVVDGQSFVMAKTNFNFQLIKPRVVKMPYKKPEKFSRVPYAVYLTAHADAAFVEDKFYSEYNPLSNTWIAGSGFGVSLVTFYDYVVRVEASVNRMRQKGIYLHLTAPL